MVGYWPDGLPVLDIVLYVRLSCGHERVSRGWRGEEGEAYCCDCGCGLAVIEQVATTDEAVCAWRSSLRRSTGRDGP
jgi:hypothetical protein